MPDKTEKASAYDQAVRDLGVRNRVDLGQIQTQLACLLPVSYTHLTLPTTPYV